MQTTYTFRITYYNCVYCIHVTWYINMLNVLHIHIRLHYYIYTLTYCIYTVYCIHVNWYIYILNVLHIHILSHCTVHLPFIFHIRAGREVDLQCKYGKKRNLNAQWLSIYLHCKCTPFSYSCWQGSGRGAGLAQNRLLCQVKFLNIKLPVSYYETETLWNLLMLWDLWYSETKIDYSARWNFSISNFLFHITKLKPYGTCWCYQTHDIWYWEISSGNFITISCLILRKETR